MARRASKVDANQPEIVRALRAMGVSVHPTHEVGRGFPDIAVGWRGRTYLYEVKDPAQPKSSRSLTTAENEFRASWLGHVETILTVDEVLEELGLRRR